VGPCLHDTKASSSRIWILVGSEEIPGNKDLRKKKCANIGW